MKLLPVSLTLVLLSFFVKLFGLDLFVFLNLKNYNLVIFLFFYLYAFGVCFSLVELERTQLKVRPGAYSFLFLITWTVILVQSGVLIGVAVNYTSIYSQAKALQAYKGSEIELRQESDAQLIGLIGTRTFQSLRKQHRESGFDTIHIMSSGGLISEAIKIADYLFENDISVMVEKEYSSACLIVATRAKTLIASPDAKFGFHQASSLSRDNSQYTKFIDQNATIILYSELKKLNIPESILQKMNNTPNSELYIVTGADLYLMGVVKKLQK